MGKTALWLFFVTLALYGVIPGLIVRIFGYRSFHKGDREKEIALTFDDGPHEVYTARLLDLLKRHNVKATFFIVGKYAERYPEVIARMHREGHLLGIHNYRHKTNWLMTPMEVKRQVIKTADIIERITGVRPAFYRPPWGIVNLFDLFTLKRFRLVLWSVIVGDWKKGTSQRLKNKLLRRLNSGDVILLHDSGETFGAYRKAPESMLSALSDFLDTVIPQGFHFVRIDEMIRSSAKRVPAQPRPKWSKRVLLFFWMQWEKLFHALFRVRRVAPDVRFLSVRVRKYEGKTIRLEDGDMIHHGDRVAELHLDNELLYSMGQKSRSAVHLGIRLIRAMDKALPKVAEYLLSNSKYDDVKGLYGISMINQGVRQYGFTVIDLPKGIFSRITGIYLRILMSVIHPEGKQRLNAGTKPLVPKIIAISRKDLLRRYHPENRAPVAAALHESMAHEESQAMMGK